MDRRQLLIGISALAGHQLFPRVLEAFTPSSAAVVQDWRPEVLSPAQGALLAEVVETILPTTDTPGAKAARVHVFVDLMLARCVEPDQRTLATTALDRLDRSLLTASTADRIAQLERMDVKALALLKELTILGYFTSEVGATQALAYDKVPGAYRGCVPLSPNQRAWAFR